MRKHAFARRAATLVASGATALIMAACGSSYGSDGNDIVVDNTEAIGSSCAAAIDEENFLDLCSDYDQPSVPVTANGSSLELFLDPMGDSDSINCFQDICATEVQAGDKFTAICQQDGYVGVLLDDTIDQQFRYQSDDYITGTNYWSSGAADGNERLTPVVFISASGLDNWDEHSETLAAAYYDIFGEEFNGDRCDARAAVETDEMEEYFTGQGAA